MALGAELLMKKLKCIRGHSMSNAYVRHNGKRECRPCVIARMKAARRKYPNRFRGYDLKKKYGITLEAKKKLLAGQGNRCAACGAKKPKGKYKQWMVDHDHKTKKVRGLLCSSCNFTIGNADENINRLKALAAYLERHKENK